MGQILQSYQVKSAWSARTSTYSTLTCRQIVCSNPPRASQYVSMPTQPGMRLDCHLLNKSYTLTLPSSSVQFATLNFLPFGLPRKNTARSLSLSLSLTLSHSLSLSPRKSPFLQVWRIIFKHATLRSVSRGCRVWLAVKLQWRYLAWGQSYTANHWKFTENLT